MSSQFLKLGHSFRYDPTSGFWLFRNAPTEPYFSNESIRLRSHRISQNTDIASVMTEFLVHALFGEEDFMTAFHHELMMEGLARFSRSEVEQRFVGMRQTEKLQLRKLAHKVRTFWSQYPELRIIHFPNADREFVKYGNCSFFRMCSGCPENMARQRGLATQTEASSGVAEGWSSGLDTKFDTINSYDHDFVIHEPKPHRQQDIAGDMERLVERYQVESPTSADDDASERTLVERDDCEYQEHQHPLTQNELRGLQQQYPLPQQYTPNTSLQYQEAQPQLDMQDHFALSYEYLGQHHEQSLQPPATPYLGPVQHPFNVNDFLDLWRLDQ